MHPSSYSGRAFNQVPDSDNRIHSDDVAREHGFQGGLVPGVTVSAYLLHPAVVAWGRAFLDRGAAHVTVQRPVYDREDFAVSVTPDGEASYDAELTGTSSDLRAVARCTLPESCPAAPLRRGDPPAGGPRVPATRAGLEELRERGMGAVKVPWGPGAPMTSYFREESEMPDLLRLDRGGFANGAFLLGTTNWLLAANVDLGPWLHLETWSQHFRAVPAGSALFIEGRVIDLFEKKGHEFVDVDTGIFLESGEAMAQARLRAIYRLRS